MVRLVSPTSYRQLLLRAINTVSDWSLRKSTRTTLALQNKIRDSLTQQQSSCRAPYYAGYTSEEVDGNRISFSYSERFEIQS